MSRIRNFIAGSGREFVRLMLAPTVANVVASAVTLLALALIYRSMDRVESGNFALFLSLTEVFGLVAPLGQTTVITRQYSRTQGDAYNWIRDTWSGLLLSGPIIVLSLFAATGIYSFSNRLGLMMASAVALQVLLYTAASMLNSQGLYALSSILYRLPNSMLIFPAVLMTLNSQAASLENVVDWYLGSLILITIASVGLLRIHLTLGAKTIAIGDRLRGLVFVLHVLSTYPPVQILVAISGSLILPEELATFAAIAILLRPFVLVNSVLSTILPAELVRRKERKEFALLASIWAVAFVMAVGSLILAPVLARLAYGTRYDDGLVLVLPLSAAGMLLLSDSLPRSHIIGRSPTRLVNRFVATLLISAALTYVISVRIEIAMGSLGIAIGAVVVLLARNIVSYLFLMRARSRESSAI